MTLSDTDGGIRLLVRKFSSAIRKSLKSGKAVNSDSTTASSGTMLSTVVKVRLEATWVSFFSAARCNTKRAILRSVDKVTLGRAFLVCMGRIKTFSFQGKYKWLSSDNTSMTTQLNPVLRHGASASLIALIVLCLLWELKIAPLRPGGSLL